MPTYYFIYSFILIAGAIFLIRFFILGRTSRAARLFAKAVKAENSGDYEEAIATYEDALTEVKKLKFQKKLKSIILGRLKVLNTVTKYKADQGFIRKEEFGS